MTEYLEVGKEFTKGIVTKAKCGTIIIEDDQQYWPYTDQYKNEFHHGCHIEVSFGKDDVEYDIYELGNNDCYGFSLKDNGVTKKHFDTLHKLSNDQKCDLLVNIANNVDLWNGVASDKNGYIVFKSCLLNKKTIANIILKALEQKEKESNE
jgi:hypothetical protein